MAIDLRTIRFARDQRLNDQAVTQCVLSHTSMDRVLNGIYCPEDQLENLRKEWAQDIVAGNDLFLSEYGHVEHFRLFFDLDLKVKHPDAWNAKLLASVLRVLQKAVRKFFPNLVGAEAKLPEREQRLLMVVLDRLRRETADGLCSFGYHIHFPNLVVHVRTALKIRSYWLQLLDTEDSHIKPPEDKSWSSIIDEGVFTGKSGPHIRGPLCCKCVPCDCAKNRQRCIHQPAGRRNSKSVPIKIANSKYDHVVVVFDAKSKKLPHLREEFTMDKPDRQRDFDIVLSFIQRFSIRTHNAGAVLEPCPPSHFRPGYKCSVDGAADGGRRKRGREIEEFDEDHMDDQSKEQFQRAYEFMQMSSGLELGPKSSLKRSLKRAHQFYSLITSSRQCPNKGDNHTTAALVITVRCLVVSFFFCPFFLSALLFFGGLSLLAFETFRYCVISADNCLCFKRFVRFLRPAGSISLQPTQCVPSLCIRRPKTSARLGSEVSCM